MSAKQFLASVKEERVLILSDHSSVNAQVGKLEILKLILAMI